MNARWILMVALVILPRVAAEEPQAKAAEPTKMDQAFDKLKAMAGEWKVVNGPKDIMSDKITYRVVGNGSAVMETLFPGTPMEMISMYHRDGDKILMTHYCAAKNQPRFRAELDEKSGDLVFIFIGGSNLDPKKDMHVHGGRFHFKGKDAVDTSWEFYGGGKLQSTGKFELKRAK